MTTPMEGRIYEPASPAPKDAGSSSRKGADHTLRKPWYQHKFNHPLALKIVFSTIPRLPVAFHPPIAAATALFFFLVLRKERKAILRNLEHICPASGIRQWWKAYKTFYSFCDFMVSYCYVPAAGHLQLKSMLADPYHGADKIDQCLQMGKGLIVWTAHLGNWEFASRLLEMHGVQVNVARMVEQDKPAEIMLRNLMQNDRLRIVELNRDRLASVRLMYALRENQIVAIQGDRIYSDYCGIAAFFGQKTRFPLGPFFLSYASGAPILPGFVVREGWLRYRVIMGDPIQIAHTNDRERDLQTALERTVGFLQQTVRDHSTQWLNFFDFWTMQSPLDLSNKSS
jgi:predicted LPLAT superfamily acyltransferase